MTISVLLLTLAAVSCTNNDKGTKENEDNSYTTQSQPSSQDTQTEKFDTLRQDSVRLKKIK